VTKIIVITKPLYVSSHSIHHSNSNRIQQNKLSTGCRNKTWAKFHEFVTDLE